MKAIASSTGRGDSLGKPNIGAEDVVIRVEGLYKRYGKLVAVKGIDFAVKQGDEAEISSLLCADFPTPNSPTR